MHGYDGSRESEEASENHDSGAFGGFSLSCFLKDINDMNNLKINQSDREINPLRRFFLAFSKGYASGQELG